MIYSVWNQAGGVYDYYQTPDLQPGANAPRPAHMKSRTLGVTPLQAAWPLPAGAKKIGSGAFARGRIAASSNGALGFFGIEDLFDARVIGFGLAAWLLWRAHGRGAL